MQLDDFSTRFLAALTAAFPGFASCATPMPDEIDCFRVPFRSATGFACTVNTESVDRITVIFDGSHVHFGGWADSVDAIDFAGAIDFIRGLMTGETREV